MPAPLYPTNVLTLSELQGMQALPASSMIIALFTLVPGTGILISSTQVSYTQDYSIRSWVSILPNGQFAPNKASFWHLARNTDQSIFVYDYNYYPPAGLNILPIALSPGEYNLNFLNLVNAENVFSFSQNVVVLS